MEQSITLLGILGSDAAREKARALPLWGAPLVIRKYYPDAEMRADLPRVLGLEPDPPGGSVLASPDAVMYWPVLCARAPDVLRAALERCRAFNAEAELHVPVQWPFETAASLASPAGEPALRVTTAFDERAIWVSGDHAVQTWAVLGTVVERIDLTSQGVVRRRLPVPAFGSPELSAWLAKNDFFLIDPALAEEPQEGAFPWGSGVLFSRRRGEQPGGMLWLGALDRSTLPAITRGILAFEGEPEALAVFPRGKLKLAAWPRWSYRGKAFETAGAWHDWKLLLRTAPAGLWAYITLPEALDFIAGDVLTWLETFAHDEALTADGRLPIELAMLLPAPQRRGGTSDAGAQLAAALGLALDPVRSGPLQASFESDRVWLRVLTPPLGSAFLVARCAALPDALSLIDAALSQGSPPELSIIAPDAAVHEQVAARGCKLVSSPRRWWADLNAAARR